MSQARLVIILGKKLENGKMTYELITRLDLACQIIKPNDIIMVAGGRVDQNSYHTEAFMMKQYLQRIKALPNRIISENQSKTTYHNIKYVNNIINKTPELQPLEKILVSSLGHRQKIKRFIAKEYFNNLDWKLYLTPKY